MKFLVKWFDLDEVVDSALVSYFHAVRLMKGEGVEEASASLMLMGDVAWTLETVDGYQMTFEKVEG